MSAWWTPPSGSPALTVEVPEAWNQEIPNEESLFSLMEDKLAGMIESSEEPEEAAAQMLADLESAGLIDSWVNRKALARADRKELFQLLARPELKYRLKEMCFPPENRPGSLRYPLKAEAEQSDGTDEMTLAEWTDEVVPRLFPVGGESLP